MKLTVFGNNATCPMAGGACSCYMLELKDSTLLLDMGNGSMAKIQQKTDIIEVDAIILSHLHFDHMADLFCAKYQLETRKAKGENIVPILLLTPKLPDWAREELMTNDVFKMIEIADGMSYQLGQVTISFTKVVHLIESYAVRIAEENKVFVYSGDTGRCSQIESAARHADLFLCEATYLSSENDEIPHHLSAKAAGEIAGKADVKKLLLTHISSHHCEPILEEAALRFKEVEVAEIMGEYLI